MLVGVGVVLLVVILSLAGIMVSFVQRALPETDGVQTLPGLGAEVVVRRDASGIPHISATSMADLARAQGYVQAQDRFFDMDLKRHIGSGRLAELVGSPGVEADRVIRTLGWRQTAEASLPLLAPETRRFLQAYADGVNAYLRKRSTTQMGLEYAVLGLQNSDLRIADWTSVDSLTFLTLMAWDLKGNYADELARARLAGLLEPQRIRELYPPPDLEARQPILSAEEWTPVSEPVNSTLPTAYRAVPDDVYAVVSRAMEAVPSTMGRGEGVGSNSWVVSGAHTKTGKPLLANDPHLGVGIPSIFQQISLSCVEVTPDCPLRVSGFSLPGVPGVIIGHNERIAWGFTNLGPDVSDFYLERLDGAGRVQRGEEWVETTSRVETIKVAGEESVSLTVRSTVHGPILSDVLPTVAAAGTTAPTANRSDQGAYYALSLAWTGLQPSTTADAVMGLNLARGWDDFRAALTHFAAPSQNVVYADVDGHIGYQAPGAIPTRRSAIPGAPPGFWPAPGWDPAYDWTGMVPFEQMPFVLDPADGLIVAANQSLMAGSSPFLTTEFDPGYRAERIRRLLAARLLDGGKVDLADMSAIQLDSHDDLAPAVVKQLLMVPLEDDAFTREARELLRDWDFTTPAQGRQSAAATYYNAVWRRLVEFTFDDELPDDLGSNGGARWRAVMERLLQAPQDPWWDDVETLGVTEGRAEILRQAMVQARLDLTRELGKDPSAWTWGAVHTLTPTHPVLGSEGVPAPVRWAFNESAIGLPGGSSIVNANGWDARTGYAVNWAPTFRSVVDLDDFDRSVWIDQTGASGHAFSRHRMDQLHDWANGRTRPWPFESATVAAATKATLRLTPDGVE